MLLEHRVLPSGSLKEVKPAALGGPKGGVELSGGPKPGVKEVGALSGETWSSRRGLNEVLGAKGVKPGAVWGGLKGVISGGLKEVKLGALGGA